MICLQISVVCICVLEGIEKVKILQQHFGTALSLDDPDDKVALHIMSAT